MSEIDLLWEVIQGDAVTVAADLPDASIQMILTSPPYWRLRDYKVAGQIGMETTIDGYIERLVEVFRAWRRVLHQDGTLWLNIGDSYSNAGKSGTRGSKRGAGKPGWTDGGPLGDKQLLLIPARVALALQADGWVLRSDIIWEKPNAMPESVTDRPTKSHEHLFMFSKQARYFYDAQAIAEPSSGQTGGESKTRRALALAGDPLFRTSGGLTAGAGRGETRNPRDVWSIPTEPYAGAHFAVMPTELARRCILAGTSAAGQCAACGAPWARVTERSGTQAQAHWSGAGRANGCMAGGGHFGRTGQWSSETTTLGWAPTCRCDAGAPVPQVVADPFTGAGTSGKVAVELNRRFKGSELNSDYCTMARNRIAQATPYWQDARRVEAPADLGPLFTSLTVE